MQITLSSVKLCLSLNGLDYLHAYRNDTAFEFLMYLLLSKIVSVLLKKETLMLFVLFNVIFIFLILLFDTVLESNRHLTLKMVSSICDDFIRLSCS